MMETASERYNNQKDNTLSQMQKPFETKNGLFVWETWTYNNKGVITDIRYYAEDSNGGNTMRLTQSNYLHLLK